MASLSPRVWVWLRETKNIMNMDRPPSPKRARADKHCETDSTTRSCQLPLEPGPFAPQGRTSSHSLTANESLATVGVVKSRQNFESSLITVDEVNANKQVKILKRRGQIAELTNEWQGGMADEHKLSDADRSNISQWEHSGSLEPNIQRLTSASGSCTMLKTIQEVTKDKESHELVKSTEGRVRDNSRQLAGAMLMNTSTPTFDSLKSTGQPLVVSHSESFSHTVSTNSQTFVFNGTQIDPEAAGEAVRENRADLLTAVTNPLILATQLYSRKIISQETLDKIRELPFTTSQKTDVILNSVESRVRTHPQDFRTLLGILASDSYLCIFVEGLRHSYSKIMHSFHCTDSLLNQKTTSPINSSAIAKFNAYTTSYYNCSPVSFDGKFPQLPSKAFINLAIIEREDISRSKADKFTKGTLHGHADEILKRKSTIELEAVLELSQGQQKMKCVFVEGAPGIGKSTLAWELCRRKDDIEAVKKYSLVILLRLREKEVQQIKTVAGLFFHCDSDLQKAVAKEVVDCEGDNILFILDGFDELPVAFRKNSFLVNLIKGVHLPRCTVLVTSRPSATADLLSVCKPQIHKHIEVIGFTQEHIEQYANSMLSGEPEILEDFLKYISNQPAIRGMMYIPLNSAIVLEIYTANIANSRPIPCTMTQLYKELCLVLLNKYLTEGRGPLANQVLNDLANQLPDDLEHLPLSLKDQLLKLGKVAYEGALRQEISFSQFPDDCDHLGFMTVSTNLYLGRKLAVSYSFLHLTVQEFLAAFYVSHLPLDEQKLIFTSNFIKSESHMEVLLRFIAGLQGGGSFLVDVLKNVPSDDHHKVLLTYCLFEAHNEDTVIAVCNELCTSHSNDMIASICKTAFQCYISGYCISASQCTWDVHLDLSDIDEAVDMLGCGLRSATNVCGSISVLTVHLYHFTQQGMSHLSKFPSKILNQIRRLLFLLARLDGPTISSLADIIPQMINLDDLKVRSANCGHEMTKLLESLKKTPLKYLYIGASGLDFNAIKALSQLIKPTGGSRPCLKKLHVCTWNMLSERIATLLLETVLSSSSIEILKLDGKMFPAESNNTFSLLKKNCNLNYLKIYTGQFLKCHNTSDLAQHLMKSLHENTSLQSMKLHDFKLNSDGAMAVSSALKINQSLKLLEIEDETLTQDDILNINSGLQHNKTLESLALDSIGDDCMQLIESGKLDQRIKIKECSLL